MMRKKIVAGNWKMNNTLQESLKLVSEIDNMIRDEISSDVSVIIAPPYIALNSVSRMIVDNRYLTLAAQNCHHAEKGAFTGEISIPMLESVGVSYVIIGHSERRTFFAESDEIIRKKIDACLQSTLIPIFCVGESLEHRESLKHKEVVSEQLFKVLEGRPNLDPSRIIIAYEPVWAIGTGKTATPAQAQEMHEFIRTELRTIISEDFAENVSILYGGSCNAENAHELFACPDIDGGLIGGASLKSRDFLKIVKSV